MSRVEISGYVQIIVGVIGTVVTVLTAPSMLDAVDAMGSGQVLPPEFAGVGGAMRIFSVVFVLAAFLFLIALGLAITFSTLTKALGAQFPLICAAMAVGALVAFAATITLAALGTPLWKPGFVGGLSLVILAIVAGAHNGLEAFWIVGAICALIFLFMAMGTVADM